MKETRKEKKLKQMISLSQEEAYSYLAKSKQSYQFVGYGAWLIFVGVSVFLFLGPKGFVPLFLAIAIAVMLFIFSGSHLKPFEKIEGKPLRLDKQTYEQLVLQYKQVESWYHNALAIGVALIILAVGVTIGFRLNPGVLLFVIGFSVFLFITSGGSKSTYDHLLCKGDYQKYYDHCMPVEMNVTVSHQETNQVQKVGLQFITQLKKAKSSIAKPEVLVSLEEIIDLTQKILYRLEQDPSLIASTERFFDYYLPTTVKLAVNYSEVMKQDLSGEQLKNVAYTIEGTFVKLVIAFRSQLEKLYFHTSIDLETDISTLEVMLKKEGLLSDEILDTIKTPKKGD